RAVGGAGTGPAAQLAPFHDKAERRHDKGGAAVTGALATTNIAVLRASRAAGFAMAQIDRTENAIALELARVGPLLDKRRDAGKVRRVHGDLHLRNICLVDG